MFGRSVFDASDQRGSILVLYYLKDGLLCEFLRTQMRKALLFVSFRAEFAVCAFVFA